LRVIFEIINDLGTLGVIERGKKSFRGGDNFRGRVASGEIIESKATAKQSQG
jgi:hypothetical protein